MRRAREGVVKVGWVSVLESTESSGIKGESLNSSTFRDGHDGRQ
jgi:hypothetical protein